MAEKPRSRWMNIWNPVGRWLGRKPTLPPGDAYRYMMAPLRRGPKGRSAAPVAEIEDDSYQSFPPRRF
jgi:hypothetical protein